MMCVYYVYWLQKNSQNVNEKDFDYMVVLFAAQSRFNIKVKEQTQRLFMISMLVQAAMIHIRILVHVSSIGIDAFCISSTSHHHRFVANNVLLQYLQTIYFQNTINAYVIQYTSSFGWLSTCVTLKGWLLK